MTRLGFPRLTDRPLPLPSRETMEGDVKMALFVGSIGSAMELRLIEARGVAIDDLSVAELLKQCATHRYDSPLFLKLYLTVRALIEQNVELEQDFARYKDASVSLEECEEREKKSGAESAARIAELEKENEGIVDAHNKLAHENVELRQKIKELESRRA